MVVVVVPEIGYWVCWEVLFLPLRIYDPKTFELKTETHIILTQKVYLQHTMLRQFLLVQPVVFENEQITGVFSRFHSIMQMFW